MFTVNFIIINYNKMRNTKIVGAGIIAMHFEGPNTRILLVRGKQSGKWSFPKGHAEPNEDIIQTGIREMKEETGIEIQENQIDKRIKLGEYTFFLVRFYNLERVVKQESEVIESSWMLLEDVMSLDINEVNYPLKLFRFFIHKNQTIIKFLKQNRQKVYVMEP